MADDLESLLRAAAIPDPDRAEAHWAEYRSAGPGAEAAFRTLLAWYGLALYRRVWGFVRSDAADDVFQDVLAKLHRDRGKLATWADAHGWLRTVAVREAVTLYRRDRRRQAREARRALRPDDADPGDGPVTVVACAELRAALVRLPESHRQVVALLFFEGLSVVEAAKVLGKDRDTVAAWRDAALGRLRKLLPAGGLAAGGSAGVEGALAAGRPVVSSLRLGDLGRAAWTRAVPGPAFGKAAAVLLAGLTLGGVGLAGWAATREPDAAQAPPPVIEPARVVERETLQAQNLRILHAEVLPKLTAALGKLLGDEPVVTHTRADGSEVYVHWEGKRPWLGGKKPPRAQMRFCVLSRVLVARLDASGTGDWKGADVDVIRVRTGLPGRMEWFEVPIRELRLRAAFDALPADDRAAAEFTRFHLDGTPYGGPELIMPGWSATVAANARYLYLARDGHLFARDARGGFIGWKRVGPEPAGLQRLAATDRHLFAATDREVLARPVDPGAHDWRPLGPMPAADLGGDWRFAAAGDRLFVLGTGLNLWARPANGPGQWRSAGRVPVHESAILGVGDRLYFWDYDGGVASRPADGDGSWERYGRWASPVTHQQVIWADRIVHWEPGRHGSPVEARPLTPGPAAWTRIGRVDSKADFLNWRW